MDQLLTIVGQRIRNYRTQLHLSQEKLAELSGCHPTYIGQIERGEKNATIESIAKISQALSVPLAKLFEKIDDLNEPSHHLPLDCYELIAAKSEAEQLQLFKILSEIDKYKLI